MRLGKINVTVTVWRKWKSNCVGDWTPEGLVAIELYDHVGDKGYGAETFDDFEFVNLAYAPEYAKTVAGLSVVLQKQFDHAGATC